MQPISNTNSFFGERVSQPGVNALTAGPNQLVYQTDYSTQTWYDISGNAILVVGQQNNSSTYGVSINPNAQNLYSNSSGVTITQNGLSIFQNGIEQVRVGVLPDGTGGIVATIPGTSVDQAYA